MEEEIGGNSVSSQISDELDISLSIFQSNEYGDLCTKVVSLSQLIRSLSKDPTADQLENIESNVNDLLENLKENSNNQPQENEINTILDAYKTITEALLILRQNQNGTDIYRAKYEELKKEYDLQDKLHQVEIEKYKKGDNVSNNSYADQIEEAKNELKSIRTQYENYKKKVDKSVSSIQSMMQLPENTTIKTLKDEINTKLKKILTMKANDNQDSDLEKERQKNENLLRELKKATDQCNTAQTNERMKDEEIKKLTESLSLFENQIDTLTKEKNDYQNSISELKNQSECSDYQDRLFLTQTELGSLNLKYSDLNVKLDRLKKKLEKSRNENALLRDEETHSKAIIEHLQLEMEQLKLENEELQAEIKSKNANSKVLEEIQAKNVEAEHMNTALEKLAVQLANQTQEISKVNEIKERLIDYIQKQSEIISAFSKESSNLQTQLKKKENDANEYYQVVKKYEDEIDSYKCFINGFTKLVSINMSQELAVPVIKSLQQLRLDGLESLFTHLSTISQTRSSSSSFKPQNLKDNNEINQRLFQYIEDQINIIQSIASTELLGQTTSSNILKSCQEADEFVKSFAPSFYDEPSIFSSFGLVVHPSKLSNSLRNFLTTFQNVTSPESRELFDIAKQAIAMNSLLRSVASIIRNENGRVYDEMQRTVENLSDIRRSDYSDAESRISETEKLLSKAVAQKENSTKKLEELKSTLKKMMEKGFVIPQKISEDLDNDGSFYIDSSEIEPPNLQESEISCFPKEEDLQQIENIEFLKDKLAKSQNRNKLLKKKIELLLRKFEKIKKKLAIIPKIEEEKEILKANLANVSDEYEKYKEESKAKFDELKEIMKQKIEDKQQATINDAASQLDRMRSEFKSQMKQKSLEMKEKLKKANKMCESQTQRADVLKTHYESVLQNLKEKLSKSRETENQAKSEAAEAEIELSKLKSRISALMVENKMLNLRLSSFEEKNKFDSSFVENQAKMKKIATDSKFEEKLNEIERRDNEFIIKIAEFLKKCTNSFNEIDSFEKVEFCIQNIVSQISELNSKMIQMTEIQSELNKIRSFLAPDPNTSTFTAVYNRIEQMNHKIYELKNDNVDIWRNWAIKITGTKESDELLMNDIELMIKQNQLGITPKLQDNNSTNEPYVKSLIGAMESMGKRNDFPRKAYPLSNEV